jgi:hypothetical protein
MHQDDALIHGHDAGKIAGRRRSAAARPPSPGSDPAPCWPRRHACRACKRLNKKQEKKAEQ